MHAIYPIRFTRSYWNIPLYCFHTCSEQYCSNTVHYYNHQNTIRVNIHDNPDFIEGRCSRNGLLFPAFIHLSSYDISKPRGHLGELGNPDMVVIPDTTFWIDIAFPLTHPVRIQVASEHAITLRNILFYIKSVYQRIYIEEEETATETTFEIDKKCDTCTDKLLTQYLRTVNSNTATDVCSICYNGYVEDSLDCSQCHCGHMFHTECIQSWISTANGTTCPICRTPIRECTVCTGNGRITVTYQGIVLPPEYRTISQSRNTTNGVYGIYGFDFDTLMLENMTYNRIDKVLYLSMCMI